MAEFSKTISVIQRHQILTRNDYLLFRPKRRGEKQFWRDKFIRDELKRTRVRFQLPTHTHEEYPGFRSIPIPAFLYPVKAEIKRIKSVEQLNVELIGSWGIKLPEEFRGDLELHGENYGVFSLYLKSGDPRPQSIHILLPIICDRSYPPREVSLVVGYQKAPWNLVGAKKLITDENWHAQYWGVDLATLIHAIRTYYKTNEIALGDEVVASWKLGLAIPKEQEITDFHLGDLEQEASDLLVDLECFGVKSEQLKISPISTFQERWTFWGLQFDGNSAKKIVDEYHFWMDQIFPNPEIVE